MLKKILLFSLIQKYAKLAREWARYFQVLKWSLCIHSIHKKTTIQIENLEEHGHIAHFAIIIIFLFFIFFFLQKYTFPYKYTKLFFYPTTTFFLYKSKAPRMAFTPSLTTATISSWLATNCFWSFTNSDSAATTIFWFSTSWVRESLIPPWILAISSALDWISSMDREN